MTRFLFGLTATLALVLSLNSTAFAGGKKGKPAKADDAGAGIVTGTINGVGDDGKTLTITPAPANGKKAKKKNAAPAFEIKLTDKTRVEYAGIPEADQKLQSGQSVTVTLADGSKDTAASIKVGKAAEPKKKKKKDPK